MATNNACNIKSSGIVSYDGAGTFTALANPLTVANGGSGVNSHTAYAPIVGGTTSTNPTQSVNVGSTGQVLQSNGNGALPSYSTPTYPSTSGTSRKIIVSDGTNNVYSTETWAVPGTSGNVLKSDGTNWTSSSTGPSQIITTSLQLTNSQIKNLNGTPVQIIAAPGSNKAINVIAAGVRFNYGGTNVFTAGASQTIRLKYGTAGTTLQDNANDLISNAVIVSNAVKYCLSFHPTFVSNATVANVDNLALNVTQPVATEISGNAANDNTITIWVTYYIVTA